MKDSDVPADGHTHTTPPVSRRKHGRSSPYRMSSVIKLEYNTSHPIYAKVQDLILKYLLMWVLPSSGNLRGGVTPEGVSSSPVATPTSSRRSGFLINGAELMREMWFTNRDNVSLLLEICRVGFTTPLSQAPTLRKLIDLYFHWEQVRTVCSVRACYALQVVKGHVLKHCTVYLDSVFHKMSFKSLSLPLVDVHINI